jgi:hypothetical protein
VLELVADGHSKLLAAVFSWRRKMRILLAAAATVAVTVSAPVFGKAHLQPADRAQFGQDTAAKAIAKNDEKSMKGSNGSKSGSMKSDSSMASKQDNRSEARPR